MTLDSTVIRLVIKKYILVDAPQGTNQQLNT